MSTAPVAPRTPPAATAKQPPAPKPALSRRGTCKMHIWINGTEYNVLPIRNRVDTIEGFELCKLPGLEIHKVDMVGGCSCADARYGLRYVKGALCKHAKALIRLGLLQD